MAFCSGVPWAQSPKTTNRCGCPAGRLARALAGEPFVLVLDEPTSSLDAHSESLIQDSLAGLKGHLTVFVVAHRLPTLAFCDRVLVLVDGAIEAFAPAPDLHATLFAAPAP